jgi:ribonuclease HI
MGPFTLPVEDMASLEALAEELHLPDHDLLLLGDGSGSVYQQPAGWACVAYDRLKPQVIVHAGGFTCGTNNFAELAPYVQALWHHHQDHGQAPRVSVEVVIVSDSELTVRCGNKQYSRNANGCLWAAIDWFETRDYKLYWQHVRRASNGWNVWADQAAAHVRAVMEAQEGRLLGRLGD